MSTPDSRDIIYILINKNHMYICANTTGKLEEEANKRPHICKVCTHAYVSIVVDNYITHLHDKLPTILALRIPTRRNCEST